MTEWVRVADGSDIVDGEPFASEWNGEAIALYRYEGEIYAIGDICTHEHVRLSDGWLDGDRIECPLHQGKFDIRDGRPTCQPVTEAVRTYPVKIENGRVFIDLG